MKALIYIAIVILIFAPFLAAMKSCWLLLPTGFVSAIAIVWLLVKRDDFNRRRVNAKAKAHHL